MSSEERFVDGQRLYLCFPGLIYRLLSKDLPLLQQAHAAPLLDARGIDVTTRFDAKAGAFVARRIFADSWDVNVFARVVLKGRFRAVNFEMDAGRRVAGGDEFVEGSGSCVEWDRGRIGIDDEAVVDVGLSLSQCEGFGDVGCRVWGNVSERDTGVVDGLVLRRSQLDLSAFDCRPSTEVKIATQIEVSHGNLGV